MRHSPPARRQLNRRRTIFSFGDLVLPFVGIMAMGLLVIAGRLFFVDGFQSAASPLRDLGAALETVERFLPDEPLSDSSDSSSESPLDSSFEVVEIPFEGAPKTQESQKPETETLALAVTVTPASTPAASPSASAPASTPSNPKAVTARSTSNATVRASNKAAVKTTTTAAGKWRVQVGAYGSRQAANEIVIKLAKAGYSATVFSSGKFHKVWVQAGSTRQAANSTASRLKKQGYPGSYVVPPAR